jgi:hypothetical protein
MGQFLFIPHAPEHDDVFLQKMELAYQNKITTPL